MFEQFRKVPSISLGTSVVSGYKKRSGYTYLWLGSTEDATQTPILWRVLSTQGNGGSYQDDTGANYNGQPLFLLSDFLLGSKYPNDEITQNYYVYFYTSKGDGADSEQTVWDLDNPGSIWQNSDARKWCQRFEQVCMTVTEQAAILSTFKDDSEYRCKRDAHNTNLPPIPAAPGILNGDRVFFLSDEEAETNAYGFKDKRTYIAESEWWTRTYEEYYEPRNYVQVGIVLTHFGGLLRSPATPRVRFFARPALNFDPRQVLLTSVEGMKEATLPQGKVMLKPVSKSVRHKARNWELTLHDVKRDAFTAQSVRLDENVVVINYQNAVIYDKTNAPDERISAIITDNGGAVLFYGNIALPELPSGEARFMLPEKRKQDWHFYILSEQCRGSRRTDYASPLIEVLI